ncbi:MAG: prolipoprotein diacylglyceryl transferase [Thermoguttaceae bacterium]
MRPTLFYVPPEIFGFPLLGCGILPAILLLVIIIWFLLRLRQRKIGDADFWGTLALFGVAEVILLFILPRMIGSDGFPIRGYGVFLLLAVLSAISLLVFQAKRRWNMPVDLVFSFALWCIIPGLIGARAFYIIEYWPNFAGPDLWSTLKNVLNIAEGGLVVLGSIIGGAIGALSFILMKRLPVLAMLDLLVPPLLLGISLGRLGCLMNGCCFGAVCETGPGITFPSGSPAHLYQIEHNKVHLFGLKLCDEDPGIAEKGPLRVPLQSHENRDEILRRFAKDKRPHVKIAEVQPGSQAEEQGLKKDMSLLGLEGMNELTGETCFYLVHNRQGALYCFADQLFAKKPGVLIATDSSALSGSSHSSDSPDFLKYSNLRAEPWEVRPVYPTQIISSMTAAIGCLLAIALSRRIRRDGVLTLFFLVSYGVFRFFIEILRTDEESFLGTGLTVSQNISIGLLFLAVLLAVYLFKKQ